MRLCCFALCGASLAALLLKCYGICSMSLAGVSLALPAILALIAIHLWSNRPSHEPLHAALSIGFTGGLLGTLAYDLSRIPFQMLGQRIFMPIAVYGVWLLDAAHSSRCTLSLGWAYHLSNGLAIGIMYALFMRERHWSLAVVWACAVESVAIFSPFGRIFGLRGNSSAIAIAYMGHVAYGIPLGLICQRWDKTRRQLAELPVAHTRIIFGAGCLALCAPMLTPYFIERDRHAIPGSFCVEGKTLNPDLLRVQKGSSIIVKNQSGAPVDLRSPNASHTAPERIEAGSEVSIEYPRTGIYQIFIEHPLRTESSFVIVEPVEIE